MNRAAGSIRKKARDVEFDAAGGAVRLPKRSRSRRGAQGPAERVRNRRGAPGAAEPAPNSVAADRTVRFGPLAEYVGYALRRAQMSSVAGFLDAMQEVDLRPTQFAVLILINENPGIRQTEVCAALGLQKANFVPLLGELQRRGLAVRKAGIPDGRSSALYLSPPGEALLQRARELHAAWEKRVVTRIGARGREQLLALLRKLT